MEEEKEEERRGQGAAGLCPFKTKTHRHRMVRENIAWQMTQACAFVGAAARGVPNLGGTACEPCHWGLQWSSR
eukprot:5627131-Pyramimonas_sp.AAC.1